MVHDRTQVHSSWDRSALNEVSKKDHSHQGSLRRGSDSTGFCSCVMVRNLTYMSDGSSPKHTHIGLLKVFANVEVRSKTYDFEGVQKWIAPTKRIRFEEWRDAGKPRGWESLFHVYKRLCENVDEFGRRCGRAVAILTRWRFAFKLQSLQIILVVLERAPLTSDISPAFLSKFGDEANKIAQNMHVAMMHAEGIHRKYEDGEALLGV